MSVLATGFGEKKAPHTAHIISLLQQKKKSCFELVKRNNILNLHNNIHNNILFYIYITHSGVHETQVTPTNRHPEANYWFLVPNGALWGSSWNICKTSACSAHIFSVILEVSFFHLCFRGLAFPDKHPKMWEFNKLKWQMLLFPKYSIWPQRIFSSYQDPSKTELFSDQFICQ